MDEMVTQAEAVIWLQAQGVGALSPKWIEGDGVIVYDREKQGALDIGVLSGAIWLRPDDRNDSSWIIDFMATPGPHVTRYATLQKACEAAVRYIELRRSNVK